MLKDFLGSKKAIVFFSGLLVVVGKMLGLEIPEETMTDFVTIIVAYLVGQGFADIGKEKAKVEGRLRR